MCTVWLGPIACEWWRDYHDLVAWRGTGGPPYPRRDESFIGDLPIKVALALVVPAIGYAVVLAVAGIMAIARRHADVVLGASLGWREGEASECGGRVEGELDEPRAVNRKSDLWVNPGRPPTRLGGDGILPYLIIPHWLSAQIAKVLEEHKIEFILQHAVSGTPGPTPGTLHPEHHDDRFIFPRAKASAVQAVMDSIRPQPRFGRPWP